MKQAPALIPKRLILIHSAIALFAINICAVPTAQSKMLFPVTRTQKKSSTMTDQTFKQVAESKNTSQLLRNNPGHYWAWAKINAKKTIPKEALNIQGWVVGDPHNKNFGILKFQNKIRWSLLDFDDPGVGPYVLDFVRFVAATKAVADIKTKLLWEAYQQGLRGEKIETPEVIQNVLSLTPAAYRELEIKKAAKFSSGDKLTNDGEESTPVTNAQIKKIILETFTKLLPDQNILDIGARAKDNGGSANALRFLALVRGSDGRNTLYELKENLDPALAKYQEQTNSFKEKLFFYLQKSIDPAYQNVTIEIDGTNHDFLLRPKQLYFFDAANDGSGEQNYPVFKALTLYNAWFLGSIHGMQKNSAQYRKTLENDEAIYDGIKATAKAYLELLSQQLQE